MTIEKNQLGRNEPCSCGSGKKFKRCCGKDAAPKLSAPKVNLNEQAASGFPGFDPSQMDPQWLAQVQKAMQKMPRGQLQRLQSVMQKAMSGKDVSREAAELDQMMPPELIEMMKSGPMASLLAQQAETGTSDSGEMSVEEARKLVEQAAKQGEISADQAEDLLAHASTPQATGKFGKLWKSITGKK